MNAAMYFVDPFFGALVLVVLGIVLVSIVFAVQWLRRD